MLTVVNLLKMQEDKKINNLAISIVTYNSKEIFKTLNSLQKELKDHPEVEVYVFDNHSSEEYQKKLREYESDHFTITFFAENKGFGFGHNYNARLANEELFLVCNPDVLINQKSVALMVDYMKKHPEVSLTAPKVLNADGTPQYLMRQKLDVFDYMIRFVPFKAVKKIFDDRLSKYECREVTDSDEIQEVLFVSGCFMLFQKKDFDAINGFDERFFMYFEDNDICRRLRDAGGKIIYLPQATIIHFYGKEAHKSRKIFGIFMRSMKTYFDKWGWQFF